MEKNDWKPFHEVATGLLRGELGPMHVETIAALLSKGTKVPFEGIEMLSEALSITMCPIEIGDIMADAVISLKVQWEKECGRTASTVIKAFEWIYPKKEDTLSDLAELKGTLREFLEKPPESPDKINIIIIAFIDAGYGTGLEQDGIVGEYLRSATMAYWSDFGDGKELMKD